MTELPQRPLGLHAQRYAASNLVLFTQKHLRAQSVHRSKTVISVRSLRPEQDPRTGAVRPSCVLTPPPAWSDSSSVAERGGDSEDDGGSAPPCPDSPDPARNPSPPPGYDAEAEEEEEEEEGGPEGDAIGNTVYSKHWLFGALTRLVQVLHSSAGEAPSGREAEAAEPRVTRRGGAWVSVRQAELDRSRGGLGGTRCHTPWPPRCCAGLPSGRRSRSCGRGAGAAAVSRGGEAGGRGPLRKQNSSCTHGGGGAPLITSVFERIAGPLSPCPAVWLARSPAVLRAVHRVVLLLLLSDADPPTLLETSRLLLTCLARPSAAPLWLERVRQQESVRQSLCFIMCSSTNVDLLLKVGELVDKLFDLDEELMRSWITPQAQPSTTDAEGPLHIAPCLLEAAKQLRSESPEGLEVYIHALQLLTTVDTGIQALVEPEQVGEELWALLSDVVCSDLCQPDDPAVALQEQKTLLAPVLAVLWALFDLQGRPECCCPDRNLPLVGSLTRVLQYQRECQQGAAEDQDVHLQILRETAAELLSKVGPDCRCCFLLQEAVSELVRTGALTEQSCRTAARSLLPQHCTAVRAPPAVRPSALHHTACQHVSLTPGAVHMFDPPRLPIPERAARSCPRLAIRSVSQVHKRGLASRVRAAG
ncbi:SAAL1 protein, partial [Atractosteus spatula]|nr:SAAL1 protein [Atractosteus spatula]